MALAHSEQFTDKEIIDRIIQGEVALFEILIRRNNPFLFKVGMSYGYSHEDVEDLMQETFISAYSNLKKFENRSSFKTWIIRIMLNQCYQRKQKMSYKTEQTPKKTITEKSTPMFSSTPNDSAKILMNRELNQVIENAITKIPIDYRMVFSLREINGLNVAETAQLLNITETNVKVRLNRAKNMLRNEIEKMYSVDEIFEFNLIYCDRMVSLVMNKVTGLTIA
jgi:RNA polymerase sigma factor (sigma-70 family)